ncbi:MAG: PAS-domain containing protein [Alphaproteobacteria bacterium]
MKDAGCVCDATDDLMLLQSAIEHGEDGLCVFDRDLRLVHVSGPFRRLLDLDPGQVARGTPLADVFGAIAGTPVSGSTTRRCERVMADGRTVTVVQSALPEGGVVLSCRRRDTVAAGERIAGTILDNLGLGLAAVDGDQRLVLVNDMLVRLLGLPKDLAAAGTRLQDILRLFARRGEYGPGDPESLAAERLARFSGITEPRLFERVQPDGTVLEVRYNPMPGGGVVFTYADITDRRRRETALRQAEQRLHAILTHSAAVIYLKDTAGRYLLVNQQFERIVGRDSGRIVGNTNRDLFHPQAAERMQASDRLALDSGRRIEIEEVIPGILGERTYLTVKVPILNAYAMPEGLCVIATDITERKQAEERLRQALAEQNAIFESATFGIAIVRDRRIHMINRALEEMLGYDRAELAGLSTAVIHASPEEFERIGTEAYAALERGETYRAEVRIRRKDGSLFWAYAAGAAIDPSRPRHGSIWVIEDITDDRRAQEALLDATHTAENANLAKSQFLANMSHELRTPLNAIIGFSDFIRSEIFGPVGQQQYLTYATDIFNSGHHLLTLINDILDLSKIEAGRFELCEETVDMIGVVENCLTMVRVRMEETNVALHTHVPTDLPLLKADRTSITQIVLNLLSNAAKFTPPGGSVTVTVAMDDQSRMVITVADSGIGIPAEALESVFEPFQQANATISRTHGGTGLGLPISRRLMTMHGGSLTLASTVGQGTTATLTFPANRIIREG